MKELSIKSSQQNRKKLITIASLILLALAGILIYLEKSGVSDFIKDPTHKPGTNTEESIKSDSTTKNKNDIPATSGVNPNKTTNQISESTTTSIQLSSIKQANGLINASISITNPASDAVCTYTFSREGAKPVVKSVDTKTNACSISIPEVEFEMIGVWSVEVKYFANNTQSTTSGVINVQ